MLDQRKGFGSAVNWLVMPAFAVSYAHVVYAQSSVTLYGIVDAGFLYSSQTYNRKTGMSGGRAFSITDGNLSASRFGIAGTEDIGGGNQVIFRLESGFNASNGAIANSNGNFFGRQAYVGMTGNFGTVKAGVQYSPFVLSIINTDPRNANYFGATPTIYFDAVSATGLFGPNAITYTTPTINGLQASAMIALGGEAGNFQAGRQYSARLSYTWKDLVMDAALFSGNSGGSAATTPVSTTIAFSGRTIGAIVGLGDATFKLSYTNFKIAGSFNEQVYSGGTAYQFTPAISTDFGVYWLRDGNNSTNHSLLASTGLYYSLSRRTTLYGELAVANNHGLMHTGLSVDGGLFGPTGTSTGVTVGIHHVF